MCTFSYVADYANTNLPNRHPWLVSGGLPDQYVYVPPISPTQQQFDDLKKEVEELKKLLLAAKEFDDKTGQHECEQEEKIKFLRQLSKFVGVDYESVLK